MGSKIYSESRKIEPQCRKSESAISQSCSTLCDPVNFNPAGPPSMKFSRQEYRSGLSHPSPGDLPDPGNQTQVSHIAGRFFTVWAFRGSATHSSILAWRIPWTEEPGRLQSMELQRDGHDWATNIFTFTQYKSWIYFLKRFVFSILLIIDRYQKCLICHLICIYCGQLDYMLYTLQLNGIQRIWFISTIIINFVRNSSNVC